MMCVCTTQWDPVCCNSTTFGNLCNAQCENCSTTINGTCKVVSKEIEYNYNFLFIIPIFIALMYLVFMVFLDTKPIKKQRRERITFI